MRKIICLLMLLFLMVTIGCASRARGTAYQKPISVICVENNPKVTVRGFEHDLEKQLLSRGIRTEIIAQHSDCDQLFLLKYVARRSMGTLTLVNLDVYQNNKKVAFVEWDAGRGVNPPKISDEVFNSVKYWQLAEALGALFGDFTMK